MKWAIMKEPEEGEIKANDIQLFKHIFILNKKTVEHTSTNT